MKTEIKDKNCSDCETLSCFIKKYCTEEQIELLDKYKDLSYYRKDQFIAYEGNTVLGLFFIKKGKVKIISSGLEGKTQVVRLAKKGGIIGHRGYGGDKYPISAVAINDSQICFIDNDMIYNIFMNNPQLTFELMMYYSKELRKSEFKIKSQAQMNVREKVADALLYCDSIFNEQANYPYEIEINRADIADLAGINTEQLSRVLSEFKKDKMISIIKNSIKISAPDQLKELIIPFGSL